MAEHAIREGKRQKAEGKSRKILDLCTGSGCLALSLAKEFSDAMVLGVDISPDALDYARKNAELNGVRNIEFIRGDLFEPLEPSSRFDLIISNPPYIRSDDIEGLQPEVSRWEPLSALDGGPEGLDFYKRMIPAARGFLNNGGMLIFELGFGCVGEVVNMLDDSGYSDIKTIRDYAGIERIAQAVWRR
jgi:release factor glutamine methyltransferase